MALGLGVGSQHDSKGLSWLVALQSSLGSTSGSRQTSRSLTGWRRGGRRNTARTPASECLDFYYELEMSPNCTNWMQPHKLPASLKWLA